MEGTSNYVINNLSHVCRKATGAFRVDEFSAENNKGGIGTLLSATAAFTAACGGRPGVLRGCIHYRN